MRLQYWVDLMLCAAWGTLDSPQSLQLAEPCNGFGDVHCAAPVRRNVRYRLFSLSWSNVCLQLSIYAHQFY